jgi:hypothetical protein
LSALRVRLAFLGITINLSRLNAPLNLALRQAGESRAALAMG